MSEHDFSSSHRHRIRRHYEHRITAGRANFDILDWASPQSQRARFEALARHVELAGRSLLDVGCGLGDLLGFLRERGIDVRYTGVDILDKMVMAARERHPDGEFVCADIFQPQPPPHPPIFEPASFDVTFCSGAFNLNLGNNEQFLPHAVAEMVRLARHAAVFNLLHHRTKSQDDAYFYFNPRKIPSLTKGLNVTVQIIDDYLHNDFTVICRKRTDPMADYEKAKAIIEANSDNADFVGPRSEALVRAAEAALGVTFPPTYRRFVLEYGAGNFGSAEFYGVIHNNFPKSSVPDGIWHTLTDRQGAGLPHELIVVGDTGSGELYCLDLSREGAVVIVDPGADASVREPAAPDFGTFFLEQVRHVTE